MTSHHDWAIKLGVHVVLRAHTCVCACSATANFESNNSDYQMVKMQVVVQESNIEGFMLEPEFTDELVRSGMTSAVSGGDSEVVDQ